MYDNSFTSHLNKHTHPFDTFTTPGELLDIVTSTPPLEMDTFAMLDRHESSAKLPADGGVNHVLPQALIMTTSSPASPASSEADSECLDDASSFPCSFTGEECPDLCGGPKNSCRSWTPPASPFYYTNEGGIFLLDDRQNFAERQKVELEHTLRDLDERLQRLEATMSPPRYLSHLDELENLTASPSSDKGPRPSERFPPSPNEGLAEHSSITPASPISYPWDCHGSLRLCNPFPTQDASAQSSQNTLHAQKKGEIRTPDFDNLRYTSFQHVQSKDSPPRYLAHESEIEAQFLHREPNIVPNSPKGLRDRTCVTKHASPQLHLGSTAYPTPLPSSPETKQSRKRGRVECPRESTTRKRRREEDDEWVWTLWELFKE